MALLNKKQLMIAIPCWVVLGAFIYFIPVQNIMSLQEHKYDCKTNAEFLQLENGTLIPCKKNGLAIEFHPKANHTDFNTTKS